MLRTLLLSFTALCLLPSAARAQDLAAAIEATDADALAAIGAGTNEEAALARAVLSAFRGEDEAAIAALRPLSQGSLPDGLRRSAHMTLSGIYMRESRFADAAASMEAAAALGLDPDPEDRADNEQSLAFARALTAAPTMTYEIDTRGEIAIERDMAQLARAPTTINGHAESAILDTGAAYSTISESAAQRYGLTFLDAQVTVSSATSTSVPTRLAFADSVIIGGYATFHNVLFAVLPDEALTFGGGVYKIDTIIGIPLLLELGRIEFIEMNGGEVLRYNLASPYTRGADSNLMLDGLQPVVVLQSGGIDVTMLLDTGARRSHLTPEVVAEHPELATGGESRSTTWGGAGATRTEDALTIPRLTLAAEGYPVTLENISVLEHSGYDGLLGQDFMRAGTGYVIDFAAMRFEIIP